MIFLRYKSLRYLSLNILCGRVFQLFSCYISQTVVTSYLKNLEDTVIYIYIPILKLIYAIITGAEH